MGEIAQSGYAAVFLLTLLATSALNWTARTARVLPDGFKAPFRLLILGVAANYAVAMLQYNLRSSTRYVYYGVAAALGARFLASWASSTRPSTSRGI